MLFTKIIRVSINNFRIILTEIAKISHLLLIG